MKGCLKCSGKSSRKVAPLLGQKSSVLLYFTNKVKVKLLPSYFTLFLPSLERSHFECTPNAAMHWQSRRHEVWDNQKLNNVKHSKTAIQISTIFCNFKRSYSYTSFTYVPIKLMIIELEQISGKNGLYFNRYSVIEWYSTDFNTRKIE